MNSFSSSCHLLSRRSIGIALLGCLVMAASGVLAEEDIPFPKLPEGAGAIDPKAAKSFSSTESGLKYRILRQGSGPKPAAVQRVEVNYHGWLFNGRVFDSSYIKGMPITFGLNQVIKGWTEGMQKIGKGGMIELEIPGYLGYGLQGQASSGIPPNATLHFLVELLDIMD